MSPADRRNTNGSTRSGCSKTSQDKPAEWVASSLWKTPEKYFLGRGKRRHRERIEAIPFPKMLRPAPVPSGVIGDGSAR